MNLERPVAPEPYELLPVTGTFAVTSPDFVDGATLGETYAFSGSNASPALSWSGAPENTASYMVTCYDPDAPTPSGFWHWAVLGIPASVTELAENAGAEGGAGLPEGAIQLTNDYGYKGFGGCAPPAGDRPHRYIFAVTALDKTLDELGIDSDFPIAKAHFFSLGAVQARGLLTGMYQTPAE